MNSEAVASDLPLPLVFAAKNHSDSVRFNSSSGGAFQAFASYVISHGGIVYGCAFDENLRATHIRCETLEEVERCMGSKYSQSAMKNIIPRITEDIENGRFVMFTGTPCQVDAVRKTCGTKVCTVDIVCHGVPSPLLFQMHLKFLEAKLQDPIVKYEHRPKNKGWGHHERIWTAKGSSFQDTRLSESWKRLFYDNRMLRPSCYECPYATTERSSDLTIADYWGIDNTELAGFNDDLGTSVVIANSAYGYALLHECDLELQPTSMQDVLPKNPMLVRPSRYSGERDEVWQYLFRNGYEAMLRKYHFYPSMVRRFGWNVKTALRRISN